MDIIKNNPYRIIGILVGTSAKDEHNKIKRLKMYIEAEEEVPEDFSFPIIGELDRTLSNVNDAVSKLTLNKNRVEAALFWFYNGNEVRDEPTFDALKSSQEEAKEALKGWIKLANSEDVTDRNASAFQNISTIHLLNAFKENGITKSTLEKGIRLKLKFLESSYFEIFLKLSADTTYKVTPKEIQSQFLNEVYLEIEKKDSTLTGWFLETLSKIEFSSKKEYLDVLISKPIEQLRLKIDEIKEIRKKSPGKGYTLGVKLYKDEKENLLLFENIIGENNIQYSSIADKLAGEILQCGVSYFKNFKDTSTDPSDKSMELFKTAKQIAIGNVANQKIDENIENLNDWKNNSERKIKDEIQKLIIFFEKLKNDEFAFSKKSNNYTAFRDNFSSEIDKSLSLLVIINQKIGKDDELYLTLCSNLNDLLISKIVSEINSASGNISLLLNETFDILEKLKLLPKFSNSSEYFKTIEKSLMKIDPMLSAAKLLNTPLRMAEKELLKSKESLKNAQNQVFLKLEIDLANNTLNEIKSWQLFRSREQRESQLASQRKKIELLLLENEKVRKAKIKEFEKAIVENENKIINIKMKNNLYK